MSAGQQPKPTALRVLEGVRGHRPLRREPVITGTPPPPIWLKGEARKLWGRTVPELQRMGLLGKIDEIALVSLCQTWALWVDVEAQLAEPGKRFDSNLHRQTSRLKNDLLRLLQEYGMTPVARARVATPQTMRDSTMAELLRES